MGFTYQYVLMLRLGNYGQIKGVSVEAEDPQPMGACHVLRSWGLAHLLRRLIDMAEEIGKCFI